MTDQLPGRPPGGPPSGPLAGSPFDEEGRLQGRRASRPSGPQAPPVPGGGPADARMQPLAWHRTGSMPLAGPLTLTGGLSLTGGLALGRRGRQRKKQTVSGFDPVVRGRGLARLSRRPQPTTAGELQRASVRWVVTFWVLVILLQRFAVPSQPVALLLPVSVLWCVYGLFRGVLEVDRHRFGWWLAAAGVSALIVPVQYALVPDPAISLTAWGLLLLTWLVFVFRLRDRRRSTYMRMLQGILKVSLWWAVVVIVFLALQLVVPYKDPFDSLPQSYLLHDYTLAYQFSYQSAFYRSNGWLGLETSFTSIQLALGVIAALLLRKKLTVLLVLLAAIACTGAQSGVQMIAVAAATIFFSRMRWALARYLVVVPTIIAFLVSPLGQNTISRLTEGTSSKTSTGQRATVPYELLWPQWIKDVRFVLFGRGPGSAQEAVTNSHIQGVLVPSPVKLFYEYGVIAGLALAVFLIFMYLGGPSRALALAMGSAYWIFQPGTTTMMLIVSVAVFVTLWTPRDFNVLESDFVPSPNAAIVPEQNRRRRSELLS